MSLDPRIDDLFEEVKKLKRALDRMTDFIDPVARDEIREILAEPGNLLRRMIHVDRCPPVRRNARDKALERSDRR